MADHTSIDTLIDNTRAAVELFCPKRFQNLSKPFTRSRWPRSTASPGALRLRGAGTGKTTLLNALASLIPDQERIVVIEETAEIRLSKPNVVRWEARGSRPDLPAVTIRDLVKDEDFKDMISHSSKFDSGWKDTLRRNIVARISI